MRDTEPKTPIKEIHDANHRVHGARKIRREPSRQGHPATRCTVERLMREMGIAGAVHGKKIITTISDQAAERAPDLIDRKFVATAPNHCRVADFTRIATWAGTVRVAFVVDTFSRRIVGWSASTSKETQLVLDAPETALWQRDRGGHAARPRRAAPADSNRRSRLREPLDTQESIAGSQHTSFTLAEHLDTAGIAASIGSVGDAYDNALMESTTGLYKTELIKPRRPWKALSQVELATAEWNDRYNHRRIHGETGHIPPVEYEANHYLGPTKPHVTAIN